MPTVDCVVETKVSQSARSRQVEALFDVPKQEKARLEWKGDVPLDDEPWNVGMIVGPSGSGKSTVAKHLFGDHYHPDFTWDQDSVLDDVAKEFPVADVAKAFNSVGFGTIPAWLRPYRVLSTGEQFRADVARRMLELPSPVVIDEFTSVVDRTVAQVGSHAIQKYIRKTDKQLVAVSCHFDIEDWLQPDWILELPSLSFRRRSLQQRPPIEVSLQRVQHSAWQLFAPFHYLTANLHRNAKCFALFVHDEPVTFYGVMKHPHSIAKDIMRGSRMVTLPDWQGLGLAFVLKNAVAAAYTTLGLRFRTYPSHPLYCRAHERDPKWRRIKKVGTFGQRPRHKSQLAFGGRPNGIYEYVGPPMDSHVEACDFLGI